MKKWWKCELVQFKSDTPPKVHVTRFVRAVDERSAIRSLNWFGGDFHPVVNEVEASEIPPVQRGLAEASLEELFGEVNARGFKVVQS